jgi:TP901 family phage tail tape measure protein
MPNKDLTFRLFGQDVNASASLRKLSRAADESGKGIHKAFGNAPRDVSLVAVAAGVASVKMAADFQSATLRLVTDAGESQKNLGKVRDGLLQISAQTGLTSGETAKGMYLVESAGYHGAAGLKVMRAAAEGAKTSGADVSTVADALTTAMTDYGKALGGPVKGTSMLIATVGQGKSTMEQLAGSLHSVLPTAASAGLSFAQTAGAVATMTAEGISAEQATENLNHAILSLQNPSQVQTKAMAAMGLSSLDVAKNLGKKGLTGTYDTLTEAVLKHIKGGVVLQNTFNQSKLAAQSADKMLTSMPAGLKKLSQGYLDGSITQADWTKGLKGLSPIQAAMGRQFGTVAAQAHGFGDALKSGQGPAATFNAQMAKMTGGQVGLQVALHLTGDHMGQFKKNVQVIGAASGEAGGHVKGWAETQQNFNQELAQSGAALQSVAIRLGTALLPSLTAVAKGFGGFVGDLTQGRPAATAVALAIGVFVGAMVTLYTATKVYEGASALAKVATYGFGLAQKGAALATGLSSGAIYANVTAMLRSKAETVALAAMYAGEYVAGLAKAAAAQVLSAGRTTFATGVMLAQKVAMIASTAATVIATGATTAFGIALDVATGPIGLIVLAIAGLVVGIVLLVTHWKQVCAFIRDVWSGFCGWLQDSFKTLSTAWSRLWKLLGTAAQTEWHAIIDWLGGIPGWIGGVFAGAGKWLVKAGTGILTGLWNGAKAGLVTLGKWELGIGAAVIGWMAGAGSWLLHTGTAILTGLWNGAKNGLVTLGRWELGIGKSVLGWIGNAGQWLVSAGGHVIDGLVNGIKGAMGAVSSVVGGIAGNVINTFKGLLGIHSPSRVFQQLGQFVTQGLVKGLSGDNAQVKSAMDQLSNKVTAGFNHLADQRKTAQGRLKTLSREWKNELANEPKLVADSHGKVSAAHQRAYQDEMRRWNQRKAQLRSELKDERANLASITAAAKPGAKSTLTALLAKDTKSLEGLASKRDGLADRLKDAQSALADAQGAWNDQLSSTADSATSLGNVADVYQNVAQQHADALSSISDLRDQLAQLDPTSDTYAADQSKIQSQLQTQNTLAGATASSTGSMIQNLQTQVANVKEFRSDLQQLLAEGLDPATYAQLVNAGVSGGGLAAARDLLNSGAGSISQLAGLQGQLSDASNALGTDVANQMDGVGVNVAQGLVNGLTGQMDSVTAAMDKIADAMVASIKKKLDIHSPSRVFQKHGGFVVAGLVKGIDGGRDDVATSVAGLFGAATTPYATAPGSTGAAGTIPGRSGALVHIDNFHATPEQSPADIAADLGWLTRGGF